MRVSLTSALCNVGLELQSILKSNDNRGADKPEEEKLKTDVRVLHPELPSDSTALFPTREDSR